jgi:carbon storage regulator
VLVLTRKLGEAIAIGDDIKIIVMQIKGKQVRLGIKASATTVVHREEVYKRIQEENKLAAKVEPQAVNSLSELFKTYHHGSDQQLGIKKRVKKFNV